MAVWKKASGVAHIISQRKESEAHQTANRCVLDTALALGDIGGSAKDLKSRPGSVRMGGSEAGVGSFSFVPAISYQPLLFVRLKDQGKILPLFMVKWQKRGFFPR